MSILKQVQKVVREFNKYSKTAVGFMEPTQYVAQLPTFPNEGNVIVIYDESDITLPYLDRFYEFAKPKLSEVWPPYIECNVEEIKLSPNISPYNRVRILLYFKETSVI